MVLYELYLDGFSQKGIVMERIAKTMVSLTMAMFIAMVSLCGLNITASAANVDEGLYVIQSALDSSKVLDISGRKTSNGTNCQLYDRNNSAAQVYRVIPVDDKYYVIQLAMTDQMVLDVSGGKGYNGCNVQLYKYNGTDAQLWTFENSDSGYYYIKSKTGYYLDVTDGKTTNGTNLQIYEKNKSNPNFQRFKVEKNYDIDKAMTYAKKYTDSSGEYHGVYNKDYNIYKYPNPKDYLGFDCANFASQCLFNAGLVATEEWAPVYRGENYDGNKAKTTWVAVNDLYPYLVSLGYPTQKVENDLSNIHSGDLVFTGKGKHATICTGYSNGKPVYCAHSLWRKDEVYKFDDFKNGYVIDMSFASCKKATDSTISTSKDSYCTYTISSSKGAKVRSNAGTSYEQKGGLAKGSVVYYDRVETANGYTWYHIVDVAAKSGSWGSYVGYWVANI